MILGKTATLWSELLFLSAAASGWYFSILSRLLLTMLLSYGTDISMILIDFLVQFLTIRSVSSCGMRIQCALWTLLRNDTFYILNLSLASLLSDWVYGKAEQKGTEGITLEDSIGNRYCSCGLILGYEYLGVPFAHESFND
ncbi:hypothetical protein PPL_04219 [Heterostelium album PN500]|uniref:Uncharacterized protein n=1 Tax=Heterostelium pallidum (strain ATCC 26659 / Pp 5 / PN500) TaxID=670386 RepID=D3B6Y8_HETP5|nr:hypothetical protein PPL_04219 [Heterostelium album PN500]EFA82531.1 hypothetical protein PPL_04219 [Heterostelium album PN500]|eukprot:XP_020434648.1 hypothetical protein PPL_04219 [Heterostelium album PN500]